MMMNGDVLWAVVTVAVAAASWFVWRLVAARALNEATTFWRWTILGLPPAIGILTGVVVGAARLRVGPVAGLATSDLFLMLLYIRYRLLLATAGSASRALITRPDIAAKLDERRWYRGVRRAAGRSRPRPRGPGPDTNDGESGAGGA
jgi:hypothetical protein